MIFLSAKMPESISLLQNERRERNFGITVELVGIQDEEHLRRIAEMFLASGTLPVMIRKDRIAPP